MTGHEMVHRVKEFYYNVARVVYWLPIIWKDRWWDSCFLLRIMEAKLRRDADWYEGYGVAVGCDKRARKMRLAAALCRRLDAQEYTTPWDAERDEAARRLWSHIKSHTVQHGSLAMHTSEGYQEDERLRRAAHWAWEREEQMIRQDTEYLMRLLRKNLRYWWD